MALVKPYIHVSIVVILRDALICVPAVKELLDEDEMPEEAPS